MAAESYLSRDGAAPRIVFRSADNGTVQGLVAAGVGSALVPSLTVDEDDERVVLRPVDVPPRVITLAWHRGRHRSPASIAFVDLARDVCAGLHRATAAVASRTDAYPPTKR